jgi:hypothetical protein
MLTFRPAPTPNARESCVALRFPRPTLALLLAACTSADTGPQDDKDPPDPTPPVVEETDVEAPILDPGTTRLRRLTRAEWLRTMRDLLHLPDLPTVTLPRDLAGDGFDNQASALTLSPLLIETWERATETVVRDALDPAPPGLRDALIRPHPPALGDGAVSDGMTGRSVPPGAWWRAPLLVPSDGTWQLTWQLRTWRRDTPDHTLAVWIDGVQVTTLQLAEDVPQPTALSWSGPLTTGAHEIAVQHLADPAGLPDLIVATATATGPLDAPAVDATYAALVPCDLDAEPLPCAQQVVTTILPRAWRRPVTAGEIAGIVAHAEAVRTAGGDGRTALEFSLRAALGSPWFLFKVEGDPAPDDPTSHPLTDHELATRLSYLVWSSLPDEPLRALADQGALHDEAVLRAQLDRLLADPRSEALRSGFLAQWFLLPVLADARPDVWAFPAWDEALRTSLHAELEGFLDSFVHAPRDLRELLTARTSTIDARLAAHYGLSVQGDGLQEVEVGDAGRGGVLGMGALLTVLSHTDRTSPTRRGAWMLGALWCEPPGSPPPEVPALGTGGTVRDQVAAHADNPACAYCHTRIDPLGLALEGFDPVGQLHPEVDSTGRLPDGTLIDGLGDLNRVLSSDPRFPSCIVQKAFTWALGRAPTAADAPYLATIEQQTWAEGGSLHALLAAIVTSEPFRTRRGEP